MFTILIGIMFVVTAIHFLRKSKSEDTAKSVRSDYFLLAYIFACIGGLMIGSGL